ncbi:MAG: NADH-quinone oxidoreductase subunit L [Alphaproteobacteria bacterium]
MYSAAIFLPLIGAIAAGLFGRLMGARASQILTTLLLFVSAALSVFILYTVALGPKAGPVLVPVLDWINSGSLNVRWALKIDTLSAVMIFVVTVVSAIVHLYSIGYMSHDPHTPRFFAYLSLFTFAMLMLVTADNLVQMFFGWEGVGVCSYLLIGFWYQRESANAAAIKAFLVNRVGDFGFALGIFGVFVLFDSVQLDTILPGAAAKAALTWNFLGMELNALTTCCILLFIGAMGKSAQLGLHTWLPDAMEGPTPVSALIHAATMVTAGVFMVCRLSPLFEYSPTALAMVTIVGAATAFFAASVGLVQNDIKRVIAYSTCSQLGYMFFAIGVSAYPAAIFHLMTHAFFKALLFLGAGSVIHGMSDEQDMRKMGGLWRHMKVTYVMMWIGSLALAGIPLFAGYYSKDLILESAFAAHTGLGTFAFWMGIVAALMTAFYSWRLIFMTFHGKPRASEEVMEHVHESPAIILIPLILLAIGAVSAGYIAHDVMTGEHWKDFWRDSILILPTHQAMEHAHHVPLWVKLSAIVVAVIGIATAYVFYIRKTELPGLVAAKARGPYLFLLNKWYFDELYDRMFVRPALWLGRGLWKGGDGAVIDGLGPDGVAATTRQFAKRFAALQTGYVYHYAFAILIGVAIFVSLYLFGRLR